jgi:hypothetical protein
MFFDRIATDDLYRRRDEAKRADHEGRRVPGPPIVFAAGAIALG